MFYMKELPLPNIYKHCYFILFPHKTNSHLSNMATISWQIVWWGDYCSMELWQSKQHISTKFTMPKAPVQVFAPEPLHQLPYDISYLLYIRYIKHCVNV